jgi:hypothetical protein
MSGHPQKALSLSDLVEIIHPLEQIKS